MESVEERFEKWWAEVGSGLLPIQDDDFESHAKRSHEGRGLLVKE